MGLMNKYGLFVFDWDGTLSSVKLLRKINERINPFWQYKKNTQGRLVNKRDMDFSKLTEKVRRSMRRKSAENMFFAPFLDFSIYLIRPKLHNDAIEVLKELKKNGKGVVLLTNGASWRIVKELKLLKVYDYFDLIISAQDLKILKPNPLGLNIAISLMKYDKRRAIYIGDMVDDVLMAKYANVKSCAVSCGFDNYRKLRSIKPDYLFRSIEDLKKSL
jgi:HAD superfamily hydrolase (TIGR01509 family)